MATKGERQALLFLAAVALFGAGTRAYRSRNVAVDSSALDRQIEAVEAVRERGSRRPRVAGPGRPFRPPTDPLAQEPALDRPSSEPRARIDLDVAAPADIEALPGIGRSLAGR